MKCPNCGARLPRRAEYCEYCAQPAPGRVAQKPFRPEPAAQGQRPPVNPAPDKKKPSDKKRSPAQIILFILMLLIFFFLRQR